MIYSDSIKIYSDSSKERENNSGQCTFKHERDSSDSHSDSSGETDSVA